MVIEKALDTYRTILSLLNEIERLLPGQNIDLLMQKYHEMMTNQDKAKKLDQEVLNILSTVDGRENGGKVLDLLDLMQQIQDKNHRLTPQIQGIMAVTREELKKIKSGSNMMRRYHSNTDKTGRRISTAG